MANKRWLEARQTQLLPVDYYHVVFTLPGAISQLVFYNKADMYGLAMAHHPHVHWIVRVGGIKNGEQQWQACKKGFFLPVRVLSRLFRRLFVEGLPELFENKRLLFFGEVSELEDAEKFAKWCTQQQNRDWVSMLKSPLQGQRQCSLTYRVIPIESPSLTVDCAR
jgi:hypothetical protein